MDNPPPRPSLSMHHVALSVADLDASLAFYGRLGFEELLRWDDPDGAVTIVHLGLPGMILELFCFPDPEPAPESMGELWSDLQRIGTKHVGLRVALVEEARAWAVAEGIAPADVTITEGKTGISYFFVTDPSGNWVEFLQDDRGLGYP